MLTAVVGLPVSALLFVQVDVVPLKLWEQLPIVGFFGVIVFYAAKLHFQDLERWRALFIEERVTNQKAFQVSLEAERRAAKELLQMMQENNLKVFESFSKAQSEILGEVIQEALAQQQVLHEQQ